MPRMFMLALSSLLLPLIAAQTETGKILLPGASGSGPYQVVKRWIAGFHAKYPEVSMTVSSVGSGAAQEALWGKVDCAKRPVDSVCADSSSVKNTVWGIGGGTFSSEEYAEHSALQLQQLPALSGPVMPVYSKDVTGNLGYTTDMKLNLSMTMLAGIFNGSLEYWDDESIAGVNPNLDFPHKRISVIVREDKSGMSATFTDAIHFANPTWPSAATGKLPDWTLDNVSTLSSGQSGDLSCSSAGGTNAHFKAAGQTGVGLGLLRNPYSIGYLEFGHLQTLNEFAGQAYLSSTNRPRDFIAATESTIKATMSGLLNVLDSTTLDANMAKYPTPLGGYPITRYVYWYTMQSAHVYESCYQAWLLFTFIEWTYKDPGAKKIALDGGWIVPADSVIEKAVNKLNMIKCHDSETERIIFASAYTPPPYRGEEAIDTTKVIPYALLGGFALLFVIVLNFSRQKRFETVGESISVIFSPVTLSVGTMVLEITDLVGDAITCRNVVNERSLSAERTAYIGVTILASIAFAFGFVERITHLLWQIKRKQNGMIRKQGGDAASCVPTKAEDELMEANCEIRSVFARSFILMFEDVPIIFLNTKIMIKYGYTDSVMILSQLCSAAFAGSKVRAIAYLRKVYRERKRLQNIINRQNGKEGKGDEPGIEMHVGKV